MGLRYVKYPLSKKSYDFSDRVQSTGVALPRLTPFIKLKGTLRARFVGVADKPHTCADRSVFCLGKAEAKNGFKKPASRANLTFSTA